MLMCHSLALNFLTFCFHLPRAWITGMCLLCLVCLMLGIETRMSIMANTLQTKQHPQPGKCIFCEDHSSLWCSFFFLAFSCFRDAQADGQQWSFEEDQDTLPMRKLSPLERKKVLLCQSSAKILGQSSTSTGLQVLRLNFAYTFKTDTHHSHTQRSPKLL